MNKIILKIGFAINQVLEKRKLINQANIIEVHI
jgi:hypothetical protein